MKTSILKEWRERRLVFLVVAGLIVVIHVCFKRFSGLMIDYELYIVTISYYIFPIVFALFLGALSFNRKFINSTKEFLADSPGNAGRMFWIRFFSGLIILLTPVLISYLIFRVPFGIPASFQISMELAQQPILYFFLSIIILYTSVCFGSILLKNKFLAVIFSPVFISLWILLLLPLFVVFLLISPQGFIWGLFLFTSITAVFLTLSFLAWQDIIIRNAFPFKKIAVVSVSIFTFSLITHAVSNLAAGYNLDRTIRQAKEEGILLTPEEAIPPSVPDEDNAALLFQGAFDLIEMLRDKYEKEWMYMPYEGRIQLEELTEEQKQSISRIMSEPEFVKLYSLIEEALNLSACRFEVKYEDGFSALLPHLARMRSLARLVAARTYILAWEENFDGAAGTVKISFLLGNALKDDPFVISNLVRAAIDGIAIRSMNLLLNNPERVISMQDSSEIISIISGKDIVLTETLKEEFAIMSDYIVEQRTYYGWAIPPEPEPHTLTKRFLPFPQIFFKRPLRIIYDSYLGAPIFKSDYDFSIRALSKKLEYSRKPYFSIKEKEEEWEKRVSFEGFTISRRISSSKLLPSWRLLVHQASYQAFLDTCKLGLAIEMYREEHGDYSDSLEGLRPGILSTLPSDPFTGEDYIYRRKDEGFIVYSVGPSQRDDGGVLDRSRGYDDIVWEVIRRD